MNIPSAYLKRVLLGIIAFLTLAADARAQRFEHQEVIEQALNVSPGQTLNLTSDRGSIRVTGGAGTQVQVRVIKGVNGGNQAQADELFRRFTVDFEQTGGVVRVVGDYDAPLLRNRNGLQVEYEIRVPRNFHVDLNTAGGSIRVETIDGNADLNTSGGSLSLVNVGGTVDAHTSGGSISAENIGGDAALETSGGSITLRGIQGAATATTSGGSISASRVDGGLSVETSGGSINLDEISGSVDASTSGGSITAALAGQPGTVRLSTSGGGVTVHLDPGIRMDVNAQASGGGVRSDLPITGNIERNAIRGTINGGGPLLSLHSSGGGVSIRER
jgi:hypothetical protein